MSCKQHNICHFNAWRAWQTTETVIVDYREAFRACLCLVKSFAHKTFEKSLKTPQAFLQLILTKKQTNSWFSPKIKTVKKKHSDKILHNQK